MEEKMHFVGWKHLHRGFLWQRRCIFPEGSICTEAFWSSEDAFCRMEVSAQRLLVEEKMHFSGEKHLHRGFLWKRRCILSKGSICTEAFCGSEDAFCQRKVSAQRHLVAEKIHFVRGKYLHNGFLKQRRCILSEGSICKRTRRTNEDTPARKKASSSYGKSRLVL